MKRFDSGGSPGIVNTEDLRRLKQSDAVFSHIAELHGDPPAWRREAGFETLCRIILEQQVSLAAAQAHFHRLREYAGRVAPERILELSDEEMRACAISRQKMSYLRAVALAIVDKRLRLESFTEEDPVEVRRQLTAIKGIGTWTADIYLMMSLGVKDIFPFGDIAVVRAARELCAIEDPALLRSRAETWRPLRSLAAFFFWHYYLKQRNRVFDFSDI